MIRRSIVLVPLAMVALVMSVVLEAHDTLAAPITLNFSGSVDRVLGPTGIFNTSQLLSGTVTVESNAPDLENSPLRGIYAAGVTGSVGGYSFAHVDPPFPSFNNAIQVSPTVFAGGEVVGFWEDIRELSTVGLAPDYFHFEVRTSNLPSDAIPTTPFLGGGGFWLLQTQQGFVTGNDFQLGRSVEPPRLSPAEKDAHRSAGQAAQIISETATLIGIVTSDTARTLLLNLTEFLTSSPNTVSYLSLVLVAAAAIGAVGSGSLGLMALAAVAMVGVFAASMAETHFRLANDPPDPNFQQVAQYSNARPVHDFGLGAAANEKFARSHLRQALPADVPAR